jgi:hypothetical protein
VLTVMLIRRNKSAGRCAPPRFVFERVGSQITGCSNLYPLNASQSVSKIWLLVFTVSCFTVTRKPKLRMVRVHMIACVCVYMNVNHSGGDGGKACSTLGVWRGGADELAPRLSDTVAASTSASSSKGQARLARPPCAKASSPPRNVRRRRRQRR